MSEAIEKLKALAQSWRKEASSDTASGKLEDPGIMECATTLESLIPALEAERARMLEPKLPIGTPTAWGKVVKYGPAYWCVPDGETVAVAVDAGMLEAIIREAKERGNG